MNTEQNYVGRGSIATESTQSSQTVSSDQRTANFLTEDFSRFFHVGPNGQTSPALQGAISTALFEFDERINKLIRDETTGRAAHSRAIAIKALLNRWYLAEPWLLNHEVAIEQFKGILITEYFFNQLSPATPELDLPTGFTIVGRANEFRLTDRELRTGVRYEIETDRMSPQLTSGTKVLLVRRDAQWSLLNDVVYVNCIGHLDDELIGRIVGSGKQTIRLRADNDKWPEMVIRRKDIMSLHSISCILFKKVI